MIKPFQKRSTLEGKTLFLEELILFFNSWTTNKQTTKFSSANFQKKKNVQALSYYDL